MAQSENGVKSMPNTTRLIALGFATVILIGALLLTLPAASSDGTSIGFPDALFTSTSAVCVTGLVVRDTGTDFSTFGHVVIILLIQVGGLGFMAVATIFFMLLGKRITLGARLMLQESLNEDRIGGLVRMMRWVIFSAFTIEGIGALLLATRFVPVLGLGKGLWYSVFHAISAFCNAGFDIVGNYSSLMDYRFDPIINFTVMALIVVGGLGFSVLQDVGRNRSFRKFRLHTKLVLTFTAVLLFGGGLFFMVVEWGNPNTLGPMNPLQKAMAALFQSVTLRTAGFNTIDQAALHPASKFLSVLWMFIGASPASTGGGIKTSTVAVLFLTVRMVARGKTEATAFGRAIPKGTPERAIAIAFIGLGMLLAEIMALTLLHPEKHILDLMFEVASAVGTVGVSSVVTGTLGQPARLLLILAMYTGRVGPLTLTLALGRRQAAAMDIIHYPEDRTLVG